MIPQRDAFPRATPEHDCDVVGEAFESSLLDDFLESWLGKKCFLKVNVEENR